MGFETNHKRLYFCTFFVFTSNYISIRDSNNFHSSIIQFSSGQNEVNSYLKYFCSCYVSYLWLCFHPLGSLHRLCIHKVVWKYTHKSKLSCISINPTFWCLRTIHSWGVRGWKHLLGPHIDNLTVMDGCRRLKLGHIEGTGLHSGTSYLPSWIYTHQWLLL